MSVPKTGLLPENPNLFEQQLEEICLLGDKIFQLHTGIAKTEQKIKSLPEQEAEQYLETVFDDYIAQKRELQSLRRQQADKKLMFFYAYPLREEAEEAYDKLFLPQLEKATCTASAMPLRAETEIPGLDKKVAEIPIVSQSLKNERFDRATKAMEFASSQSVGFFSSGSDKTESMSAAFQILGESHEEILKQYEEWSRILLYVRVRAFRNLYLAADLINLHTLRQRGDSFVMQHDIEDLRMEVDTPAFAMTDINVDVLGTAASVLMDNALLFLEDRNYRNYASQNPKTAMAHAALNVGMALLQDFLEKQKRNAEIQEEITQNFRQVLANCREVRATLMRMVEIIKGVHDCNEHFMEQYQITYAKVFAKDKSQATKEDFRLLTDAVKAYSRISSSTIIDHETDE